jgi:hypothetical protein
MPATLLDNLVDDLVPVVDSLRADLYQSMGNRQFNVHVIKRRWSGAERGDGDVTVLSDITLSPMPNFVDETTWELMSHGRVEEGEAGLTEVSLTYSEDELTGGTLAVNEECYLAVVDARGQGVTPMYFVISRPPVTDRDQNIGWVLALKRVTIENP